MTTTASGPFEVKLVPQPHDDNVGDATVGRMSIEKQFHGNLQATSKGQTIDQAVGVDAGTRHVEARPRERVVRRQRRPQLVAEIGCRSRDRRDDVS